MTDNDSNIEDVLEDVDTDTGEDADSDSDADQDPGQPAVDANKDKRISDLTSMWQKAEARAKALEAKTSKKDADGAKSGSANSGEGQQWIQFAQTQARDQIFASDPRFAELGLDRSSIAGTTPAEMQESGKRLMDLLDTIETTLTTSILKKHGLSPEVKGAAPAGGKRKGYDEMSDEDFEKELARAKSSF